LPLSSSNPAIADGLQPEKGATLQLYNWDQYIWKKVLDEFGAKYDCKVQVSTFNNMDEASAKLRSGQASFDVFFPTVDVIGKYALSELIQPINHSYLPNLPKTVWPQFSQSDQPFYDVGQHYTVPYTVWSTGIGWRNDLVDPADAPDTIENPYDILWNTKYKGKLSTYDDYRESLSMSLLRNDPAVDVNTGDSRLLAAARDALLETVDTTNIALTINGAYEDLPKGIFYASLAWSGDIINSTWYGKQSRAETIPLMSYWWQPERNGIVGNDCMTVLKSAKNPVLAHLFLNYMLDFGVAMKNFSWTGYQPPQIDAPPEAYKDPSFEYASIVPTNLLNCVVLPEDFDTGKQEMELAPEVDAIWHDDWEQVTSGV
jgi:spermidine/putrescine transport system substrate-binding protein